MLLGAWGVRPIYGSTPWVTASSCEVVRFTDTTNYFEYHLCLKCHSDWAWGSLPPTTADFSTETNQAIEFNPNNPAYHNVTGQPDAPAHDIVFGTSGPPAYINGWGPDLEMTCTDCHSSDGVGPSGPHGSIYSYMLKKRFKAEAGALDNTGQPGTKGDLCFECHDPNTYLENATRLDTNFAKNNGDENLRKEHSDEEVGCFMCHAAVIHGFRRIHFIVYEADGPPCYKGPTGEGLTAWVHNEERNYKGGDCTAACHDIHRNTNPQSLGP